MYERAAELADVAWCPKLGCSHMGASEPGTVHFYRQRYTRHGLYDFLLLAWRSKHPDYAGERWQRDYACLRWVQTMARRLGVRLPRSLFDLDRAMLREQLSDYAYRVPSYARPVIYKEAKQWAKER
jgi:hypothetical protein